MTIQARAVVGRGFGSELVVLAPPYRTASALGADTDLRALSLGGVVVASGEPLIAGLAELTLASYRCPWAVPCIALSGPQSPLEPLLMLVTELRDRLVVVRRWTDPTSPQWFAHVVEAVRQRPLPEPRALAEWIGHRVRHTELERPLRAQFEEALQGAMAAGPSPTTYRRVFAHYGRYSPRDWRAIARLCRHAAGGGTVREHAAARLPERTVSRYARQYLSVTHQMVAKRLGWEWVVEAALRTGAYV